MPFSDRFASRPAPLDELRRAISPDLRLHAVDQAAVEAVDPLTYEVVRHRIWSITDEMGDTLKRMSGSTSVTEVNDFDFTIGDELGQEVQVGLFNTGLVAAMDLAIYWTLRHRSANPGIAEGDMFLCNDPWVGGGLHQNDVAVLAPIFHDGLLFGWSTAICHVADLGGVAPGSFSPTATDVFAEAVPTPPIKIVRGGVIQDDVVDAYLRRSRVPEMVGLDLRAKIGANRLATERMLGLIGRYGADLVKAVMKRMMDDAERRLRAKLTALPDGTWHAVGTQEQALLGDRGLYTIELRMTKVGDHLTFDFTGTDPQHGMINCPYAGMRAGVMFAVLPILAGDIPWAAGGLMRCFDLISEEGTINNAAFPAAVSKAPVGPAWATANLVAECLGKMLDTTAESRSRVQSVCAGTYDGCLLSGVDAEGRPFLGGLADTMASGFGAQPHADGVDTAGLFVIPMGRAPDVEMTELTQPLLYLWRREEPDTGGAGRQRGGLSGSVCVIPHGTRGSMTAMFTGSGKAASMSPGLAGGYPGGTQTDLVVHASGARAALAAGWIPATVGELGGEHRLVQAHDEVRVEPDGVIVLRWAAGGGYGDPLLRDPAAVARDVAEGKVSDEAARTLYGVAPGITDSLRHLIRERRREHATVPPEPTPVRATGGERLPLDDNLRLAPGEDGGSVVVCAHCDHALGRWGENYLAGLPRRTGATAEAGPASWPSPHDYVDEPIEFRQFYCPGCYTALLTQVVPARRPIILDRAPATEIA
ncbi:hydantoinase B/oxoprolinase family protein [Spongiactinospora gelatinilytica]|uniref:hydantoinase B/oxoprolinase family protein n=1 Tax=Spongiactinospora gelatinilytica TaxID=2666298 RepID=UPI0018F6D56E|nr:hydantoinase B/oxoprolinase family protein [Spongiactinospora gelatinilytica]